MAIRFSHRFVGPMIRFQETVKQLAEGKSVAPVKLRHKDFWTGFAEELNQLSARVSEPSAAETEREEELIEC